MLEGSFTWLHMTTPHSTLSSSAMDKIGGTVKCTLNVQKSSWSDKSLSLSAHICMHCALKYLSEHSAFTEKYHSSGFCRTQLLITIRFPDSNNQLWIKCFSIPLRMHQLHGGVLQSLLNVTKDALIPAVQH